ncbi:kelch-like protein 8 isoform X2 [Acanthaster planci]|uniref:Kelch-like protein 8 isoform X2 n=1 Tax=Acanthaster planci TaxID=133434 RepID=A0A8B7XI20_ACAPL|nr:kelch-like protein 8 isoform X2 [Acanthaster planci]XP_022079575.1 kelch-like protein 8 isoform X2 [Acanthaster planci]XP_022079577.1 kelch-like protein 8 isoform X2 [Acanthaster planci]
MKDFMKKLRQLSYTLRGSQCYHADYQLRNINYGRAGGFPLRRPNSTIIIEISGTTTTSTNNNNSVPEKSSHATMGDKIPEFQEPITSLTFECHTHWQDSFLVLRELYERRALCDVTLEVGTAQLRCHRLVLACGSPYFRAMLTSEMRESREEVISIHDIDETSVEALVAFLYTSTILLTVDNVQKLLRAASLLQIETVAKACCDFMASHLHPSNCLGVRSFAELHGQNELLRAADLYTYDHFREVVSSEEFPSISPAHLYDIIASPDIRIENETQVYQAVMKWVRCDLPNRVRDLPRLISAVRLPMVPLSFLMEVVESEELIKKCHGCRDFVDEAKNYHLSVKALPLSPKRIFRSERSQPRKSTAGVLFVVGGRGASGDPFKSIECYDLRSNRWFHVAELNYKRRHVGVVSSGGKVYAAGGHDGRDHLNSMEVFDPRTNKWTLLSPMKTKRRGLAVTQLGGPLYAIGGLDDNTCFSEVERYDIASDTWSYAASMTMARGGVAVATLNDHIYAVGGNDGSTTLNTCERYDPHLNKWTMVASMQTRRAGGGVLALNGYLYVIGGFDDSSPLNSVERYDPRTKCWSSVKPMSECRGGVGVSVISGKIYAIGGHNGSSYLMSGECYDPDTDKWTAIKDISTCRAGAGVVICHCLVQSLKDIGKNSRVHSCV